jgi:hypothetical protein
LSRQEKRRPSGQISRLKILQAPGRALKEFVESPRLIGGIEPCSTRIAAELFKMVCKRIVGQTPRPLKSQSLPRIHALSFCSEEPIFVRRMVEGERREGKKNVPFHHPRLSIMHISEFNFFYS